MICRHRPLSLSHRPLYERRFFAFLVTLMTGILMLTAGQAIAQSDFGDYNGFGSASSTRDSTIRLGALVDSESSAQTNALATGDDNNNTDDEDGVTLPVGLRRGESNSIVVNVTNQSSATVYLNAWVDYNRNGTLADDEQIAKNVTVAKATSNSNRTINFTVPSTAVLGDVGIRVRITSNVTPGPLGADGSGEVEDYLVPITTGLSVGNLVWNDTNDNGRFDSGESGINNVLVELWSPGADNEIGGTGSNADTKLATTTTAGSGGYLFSGLTAGQYFVKVPTPPLSRVSSVTGLSDNGFDDDNNGSQPGGSGTAAYSGVFQLTAGTEPGFILLLGGNLDDTIDFGFVANVGSPFVCDNRFYIIQNVQTAGVWDSTLYYINDDQTLQPLFIYSGKKLNGLVAYGGYLYCVDQNGAHLYRINSLGTLVDMGEIPGLPTSETDGQWGGGTSLTSGLMIINRYTFSNARTMLYTIDLGSASLVGDPVVTKYANTGNNTTGNFGDIVWDPLTDKVYGYNTNDSNNLGLHEINLVTGMCTRIASSYLSTFGSLTIDANGLAYGYGSQSSSTSQDTLYIFNRSNGVLNGTVTIVGSGPVVTNSDGAACPGAPPSMAIGNHVWRDTNNNGIKDSGEAGISGVTVQLFLGGEDPLTAAPAATTITSSSGVYTFNDLSPGQYFVYIPTPPAAYPLSSTNTDTADNGQDNDDNGIQTAQGQPVRSPLISLVAGTEPTNDGDTDSNTNLTIDFGFLACPTVTVSGIPPTATVGTSYSYTFSASGGTSPYTWSVISGTLPSGLSLSSAGVLSGTPTTPNEAGATVTLRATDSVGCAGTVTAAIVVMPNTDFGDYASFLGASSIVTNNLRIGALVDAESSATTNPSATGDDITGSDDEDGVVVPTSLERGVASSIAVTVTNTTGSTGYLHAWIDYNRNGSLTDSGEQIASNVSVTTGNTNSVRTINFTVPAGASLGASAVRVRLTSVQNPGADGADGNGEVEDYAVSIGQPVTDFGDYANFATAANTASANLRLGAAVDVEGFATTNSTATGDDITGDDDEDGVVFDTMTAGQSVTLPVAVTNLSGSVAYLNAWIDFNNDGDVLDEGEQIAANRTVASGTNGGSASLAFDVPANAVTATPLGARFRLTSAASPGSTGTGGVGEVEDYVVTILAPSTDFGDWDRGGSVSNTADTRLRLGATVDAEYAATTNTTATGDDITGVDDEDGVTIPNLMAGAPVTWTINRTNTTGAVAYLSAWIDYNNNGVFTDSGEQIITNTSVANNTNAASQGYTVTVPSTAVTGTALGARFRITTQSNPGPTGNGGMGEVEDYVVTIVEPTTDFGDYASFGAASSERITGLRIGAAVDVEYAATTNATATGDDVTGTDDEDGATIPSMIAGAQTTIPILVTNTSGSAAFLNVWMDFNGNGDLTDAGEQIATNIAVATGTNNATRNVTFTVPTPTLTGVNLGLRIRLTSVSGAAATGAVGNGEVEDYVATVTAPTTDFGDYSGFADASQGVSSALRLGATVDAEYVSTRNASATGDDLTDTDDEDGITIPVLTAGGPATITASVTNTSGSMAYLNAWIDYNNNGVLTDAGEQVATNLSVATGTNNGSVPINVTVPVNAVTGANLGVRFRLSSQQSPGSVGSNASSGEVEDYAVTIAAPTTDFGDASTLGSASSTVVSNILLGDLIDAEFGATTNASASGDDITGVDDEDGVTMPASINIGASVTIPVKVTNGSGANAYLHAWIDFNNDGVLNNALVTSGGERLEAARLLPLVTRGSILLEWWLGISGTAVSDLTSNAAYPNNPTGSEQRTSFEARTDWENNMGQRMRGWVYPPVTGQYTFWVAGDDETQLFLSTDDTSANATMIANVPGWTNSRAWTTYAQQKSVSITLQAGRAYYIEALMKEGGGGDNLAAAWEIPGTGSGPVVIDGQYLAPWTSLGPVVTTEQITFTVPESAVPGVGRAARFRVTNLAGTTGTGASGNGEVEDYVVTINSPTHDFGDHSSLGSASNAISNNLRLGALVDAEVSAMTNAQATGDDLHGSDDEDGVTLPAMTAGQTLSVPIVATNSTGSAAYLNAWIDFNNNGSLSDVGEQVITNLPVANGSSGVTLTPNITIPTTAVTGSNLPVRFRLTTVSSPGATGVLASVGEVEDYGVNIQVPTTDFGDFSGFSSASSTAQTSLRIGSTVDVEYVGTANGTATGDDNTGTDDEDGVTLPTLTAGAPASIQIQVTNTSGATAYFNAWIDYNNNGVLTDSGEQIAADVAIPTGLTNYAGILNTTVPADAVTSTNIGVRFRITSVQNPGATGAAGSGEVEDYVVNIAVPPSDYGDWIGAADAFSNVVSGLRIGSAVDTEFASTRNSTANGDDITGTDDEDGVTLPAFTAGAPATIPVVVTNTTGSSAYLNAWMDFNNNGSFNDAGEQLATNVEVSTGSTNVTRNLALTVPANAITGVSVGLRFRVSNTENPGSVGGAGSGEVEDYTAAIAAPITDFGDWDGAADAWSTASSNLRLGALADTEYVSTRNSTAAGDDSTGSDDEDGVTLPSMLGLGSSGTLSAVLTNNSGTAAYLNAWVDFNGNGSFTDGGEQIVTNTVVANGSNGVTRNFNFTTPSNAKPGERGVRVRLTNVSNPGATGGAGTGEVEDYLVTISCPQLSISPSSLTTPVIGSSYNQNFNSNGGTGPYTFTVSSGSLPSGLNLSSSGSLTGIATSTTTVNFTVTATDANGCFITQNYTVTPVCPAIPLSPSSVMNPVVGSFYSQTITASGGTQPYTFTIASGGLPPGLTLGVNNGTISGTTSQAGPVTFTLLVTDFYGCTGTQNYSMTPSCQSVSISPSSVPGGTVGTAYSQTFSASGGAAPYSYVISSGSLPAGLSLSSAGVLSGTPTAGNGSGSAFIVRVTDSRGCSGTRAFSLKICPLIGLSPAVLPEMTLGAPYNQTISATEGTAPYTFNIISGTLPNGMNLNSTTGVLSGTPSSNWSSSFTIRVTDASGCTGTRSYTVQPVCPTVTITTSSLAQGTVGVPYSQTLSVTGGNGSYNWSIISGSLPNGMGFNSGAGQITGTPSSGNGTGNSITFRVTDAYGCSGTATLLLKICPAISLSPTSLPTPRTASNYAEIITATGGVSPYSYAVSSGSLPTGLSLSADGVISGTPTSTDSTSFVIRATDANGCIGTRAYTMTPACALIAVNSATLTSAYISTPYSTTLSASQGTAPFTWSITSGSLPVGLSLSNEGIISGTPTALGSSSFTVRVTDANGCSATRSLTLTVKGMSLGNLVWLDNDNDGVKDTGENGVAGAVVQLFSPGTDNAIGGSGSAADTQVDSSITTGSSGVYSFINLAPGRYYVRVTPPAGYTHTSGIPATTDNNVDGNNDGTQPGGQGTALFSPVILLQPGTESTTDGDADADTNLTVDFGLWAPMAVGNMVFMDINKDGWMNANEGIENVFIQIFAEGANVNTDAAVGAAITDVKGRFIITELNPGSYFLHLAAIQFDAGGVLNNAIPMGSVISGDDDVGQNLVFNNTPSVNGASTAVFTLIPGQMPAGNAESGIEGMTDDEGMTEGLFIDANTDMTLDLGLDCLDCNASALVDQSMTMMSEGRLMAMTAATPTTFTAWQEMNPLGGANGASDNPDGDFYTNLLEYALGTNPADGTSGAGRVRLEAQSTTGTADMIVLQSGSGGQDITLSLEASRDGLQWAATRLAPERTYDEHGNLVLLYAQVDSAIFAGEAQGLIRLKVSLDADLNGTPEASATAPAWMYSREAFPVGTRSFSMPLDQPELYAGTAFAREGDTSLRLSGLSGLTLSSPTTLEILDGTQAGQRYTVVKIEGGVVQTAETLPTGLAGARVALRPLWTVQQLLPAESFLGGDTPETADRVLYYDAVTNDFVPVWLSASGWVHAAPGAFAPQPGQGMLVQTRSLEVTTLITGQVSQVRTPILPKSGTRFMGLNQVTDASPEEMKWSGSSGYPASTDTASATRLRVLKTDAGSSEPGYDSFYLHLNEPESIWLREGDASGLDQSQEKLLKPFRAFFLVQP